MPPAVRLVKPRDHPQNGGFSASRRPEQREELACVDAQVHAFDDGYVIFENAPDAVEA